MVLGEECRKCVEEGEECPRHPLHPGGLCWLHERRMSKIERRAWEIAHGLEDRCD
jgi:hypothetical protein